MIPLRSRIARDETATRHLGASEPIAVRTRTGLKIHAASAGSSVTYCGHWLRAAASGYRVRIAEVETWEYPLCERCFRPDREADCPYCAPDEPCALHIGTVDR